MTSSWLEDLIIENSHVETPESWLYWSLLCCISAAAGNNYYVVSFKGSYLYRPNIFVMLLGESGLGKGYPINLAKRLMIEADTTRVIAGRSSIQAIVTELATTKSREGQPIITDSRAFIVNGELSTAIIADPDALTILTDLYDGFYNPTWDNLLKISGKEKLKHPYITALFGSSPAHFYDSIPQANIDGGYIGRNLIIYEEQRSKDVDMLDEYKEGEEDNSADLFGKYIAPKYVPHLKKISSKAGRVIPTEPARQLFNAWRKDWRIRQKQHSDKTGFLNRVPDQAMRVATCLSLSRYEFNGWIDEMDIREAIEKVTHLIYSNKRTTAGRGKDVLAESSKMVLDFLLAAPENKLTRKQLLTKGYGHYNTFTFDQLIDNLLEIGWVKRSKTGVGKNMDWIISLSGEPLTEYLKFKEVKTKR